MLEETGSSAGGGHPVPLGENSPAMAVAVEPQSTGLHYPGSVPVNTARDGCAALQPLPARRGLAALPKSGQSHKRWVVLTALLLIYPSSKCCWWLWQAVTGSAKHSMCCPPAGFTPLMSKGQEGQWVSPSCHATHAWPGCWEPSAELGRLQLGLEGDRGEFVKDLP